MPGVRQRGLERREGLPAQGVAVRILANENVPGEAVKALREKAHDVAWACEDAPGSSDILILARARGEERILITFDKDFGELALRFGLPASSGIILFRLRPAPPSHVAGMIAGVIDSRTDWAGHFPVIEEGRIRMTPLSGPQGPHSGER